MYFGGFLLILFNFGFFGMIAQTAGFIMIFRTFLPDLYDYVCKAPLVGGYLSNNFLIVRELLGSKLARQAGR